MTLGEYLTYNSDDNNSKVFENLYAQLEIIHKNGLVVSELDADHITLNEKDMTFEFGDNYKIGYPEEVEDNLLALTKIYFGTFVGDESGFKDFSKVSTYWIKDNFEEICETIDRDDFNKDFFERVFNGETVYLNNMGDMGGDRPPTLRRVLRRSPGDRAFVYKQLIPAILISLTALLLVVGSIIMK
jgi:hypothetical protein